MVQGSGPELVLLINAMNFDSFIDKTIAECLYLGIMTDTGSFKFSSTTSKTHQIIAKLIDAGADNTKIHDLVYDWIINHSI